VANNYGAGNTHASKLERAFAKLQCAPIDLAHSGDDNVSPTTSSTSSVSQTPSRVRSSKRSRVGHIATIPIRGIGFLIYLPVRGGRALYRTVSDKLTDHGPETLR
jgi:hypothetical protein